VLLAFLPACDGFGDDRLQRLEQELRALRAAQAEAPVDLGVAMAPLRGAVELLMQRAEVDRARCSAIAQELTQLATLMSGFVDDSRRVQVEALRARVLELERQTAEQAKTQGEERDQLLRALDATATKLEALLREVTNRKGESLPSLPDASRWRSLWQPQVLWPLALALGVVVVVLVLARRSRSGPRATALDLPDAVVDPPPFELDATAVAPGTDGVRGPVALRVAVGARDGDAAWQRVQTWVASEPRILAQPPPDVERRGTVLQVRVFVADSMPLAERASLAAELAVRGRGEGDRRSA
jgi:hypothetical protein